MRSNLAALLTMAAPLFFLAGCGQEPAAPEVVLYSSVDDYLLRDVVAEFEQQSGIKVQLVGDTEATKTTGLVQRLISERGHPRADVWWSSEAFGTLKLAGEGLLEPYTSAAEADLGSWPQGMRAADGTWYAFASRARVIVFNTGRVKAEDAPRRLSDLADAKWRGRIGMARPQFGTTRGQMAALCAAWGKEGLRTWLTALKANGVRLYDGNASVVRAAAHGEIDVGLTDTDDVWAGQREGFPVELVFDAVEEAGSAAWWSFGPLPMPNTVARVKGGPNAEHASRLIDFILSERVERMLAASDSHNTPVRPALAGEFTQWAIPASRAPSLSEMQAALDAAMGVVDEVLAP